MFLNNKEVFDYPGVGDTRLNGNIVALEVSLKLADLDLMQDMRLALCYSK